MLDYDKLQYSLESLAANAAAAESHGTLCGLLMETAPMSTWVGITLDELPESNDALAQENLHILKQCYDDTLAALNNEDMTFELLLPDDEEDFGARLQALADWCQGFLYGLGSLGGSVTEQLDEQAQECLSDLTEISKLSHDESATEEAEQQFAELVEHVRMITLFLNESINPVHPAPTLQ